MKESTFKQALDWFCKELSSYFPPQEAQSLFFVMMDDGLGYSKSKILSNYTQQLSITEIEKIASVVQRLKVNEPIQYILEKTVFCDLTFIVKPGVLIPRPETEELVQMIISENKQSENLAIADIGSGSGCIPISLARYLNKAKVSSVDVSEKCLEIARFNAEVNKLSVNFIHADILDSSNNDLFQNLDIVVSNPPYVFDSEKAVMKPNVLEHEPHLALFVPDNDPLLFYRSIILKAYKWLVSGGRLYFEINEQCGKAVADFALENGFSSAIVLQDLFGKDRFVKAVK